MAKVSPVSIKYMIHASFKAEGPVEKPDVIGALFGQTEGLLGSDLEMRELQKEGKIGRIEVDLETVEGKTIGDIQLPSALDKSETTIIAAALETIDRIGPTESQIQITKIEDVRGSKRDFIIERAKKLLAGLETTGDFEEMTQSLKTETRAARIQEYGEEKLPVGDISGNEVIVVEGRADVVNLLKNRVNNVIGMNGTKLPSAIAQLGEEKELTLFVDGDRGGKLIARNVCDNAKIAYIASAPDGKEVEELQGKEILVALRKKVTPAEFFSKDRHKYGTDIIETNLDSPDVKNKIKESYKRIEGTKKALLLNSALDTIKQVSSRDVLRELDYSKTSVFAIIIDGTATSGIINACDDLNVKHLAAKNFSSVSSARVNLISL